MPKVLLALLALVLGGCAALPFPSPRETSTESGPTKGWVQVSTPHFDVAAASGEKAARKLADELEAFHGMLELVLGLEPTEAASTSTAARGSRRIPIPVKVHLLRSPEQAGETADKDKLDAFPPSMRAFEFGAIERAGSAPPLDAALHQYVHLFLDSDFELDYPLWLSEGLARFLSTARYRDNAIEIAGQANRLGLEHLNLETFPIERLLAVKRYGELNTPELAFFEIASASLVHYLLTVNEQGGFGHAAFKAYRKRVDAGVPPRQAFEIIFGESPKRAGENINELFAHKSWPRKRIEREALLWRPDAFPAAALPPADVFIRLADFALARFDFASAEQHARAALSADPERSRPHAFLGALAHLEQDWLAAERHFEQAAQLGPDHALNWLDWAEAMHARAAHEFDEDRRAKAFERTRMIYQRSLELDPNHPETLAKLGETYLEARKNPRIANAFLQKAYARHPASWKIVQHLAAAQFAIGRNEQARQLLWEAGERLHMRWTDDEFEQVVRALAAR